DGRKMEPGMNAQLYTLRNVTRLVIGLDEISAEQCDQRRLACSVGGDHAFQLTLRKRFNAGLLLGLASSFSKSIDDQSVDPMGSSSGGGLTTTNSRTPTDIRNWRNERALSDFDRKHVVNTNFVYDLPVGKGRTWLRSAPAVVNYVIGGRSINGL